MDRFTISVNLLAHCLCTFPVQPEEETDVQTDTDCCGHRSCKTDFGQAGIRLDTHIIGQGKSDQKSLNQSLAHHPEGFVISVKISDHTEQHEYDTILELTDNAIEIYPFDEWQSLKIDALMGMNRYKEAYQLYDATSKMFFEELGITPSERMMNQFQEMSERMGRKYHAAGEIKEDLKEPEYEDGAFYCSLPSFRDNYRLVRRLIERNGQSAFLMVCSLTDGNGHPMENREKLDVMSMELHRAVKNSLRRGDSFSKYSPSQFLILLVGTSQENCDIIFRRIAARFTKKHGSWNKYLEYYVSSIADVENPNARLSFQKNEFRWK